MSPICKETFNVNKESENVIIHKIDTKFPCNVCNKQFKRKIALDTHLKTHKSLQQNVKFSCDICHKRFNHERYLMKHKRHQHSVRPEGFYPSDICHEFKDSAKEAILRCEVCSELFTCQRDLQKHKLLQTQLPDERCFRKYYCITNFTTIKKNNDGSMSKLYSCDLCQKQVQRLCGFRLHMAKHFRKKNIFSCDLCGKKFNRRSNFMRHMTLKHYSNKPRKLVYNCAVCCKQFDRNFNFKRHMTLMHNKPRKLKMKEVSVDLERLQIKGLDLVKLHSNTHSDYEILNIEQNNPITAANQRNSLSPPKHLSQESKFAVYVYASEILDMDIVKQEQDDLVDDNNIQENLDHFVSVFHQQTNLTTTEDPAKDKVEKAIIEANSNLEKKLLKESLEVDKAVENDGFVSDTAHTFNHISVLKEICSKQDIIEEVDYNQEITKRKSQRKAEAVSQQNKNEQSLSWRRDLKETRRRHRINLKNNPNIDNSSNNEDLINKSSKTELTNRESFRKKLIHVDKKNIERNDVTAKETKEDKNILNTANDLESHDNCESGNQDSGNEEEVEFVKELQTNWWQILEIVPPRSSPRKDTEKEYQSPRKSTRRAKERSLVSGLSL